MDPIESVRLDHDTTYALLREAARRGHDVFHVAPSGVAAREGRAWLAGRPLDCREGLTFAGPSRTLGARDLDAVLIRTDPPFDADYLAVTHLLDLLPPEVVVLNRPAGLRDANEKLAALHFPDITPPTLVSSDPADLDAFREVIGDAAVAKPIDGHGGAGVLLVRGDDPNRRALWLAVTRGGTVKAIAQQVVPGHEAGDARILLLDGRPIGAVLRRSATGAFVHNLAAGGEALPYRLTDSDRLICDRVGPWLRDRGLWFVGIDVVGGRLIEINVTSPTGLQEIERLDGRNLAALVIDSLEARGAAVVDG